VPFGLAFGLVAVEAGLSLAETVGFSAFVFAGSSQFAAVSVLDQGGTATAAVVAGLLLNLRSLAFGLALAPILTGRLWRRALGSQLMIDESAAVAAGQRDPRLAQRGYLVTGVAVFICWNLATLLGATAFSSAGSLVDSLGLDATIPAAFLALLWPRLADRSQRVVAVGGAVLAVGLTPLLPAGVVIIAAASAVVLGRPWRPVGFSPSREVPG
jgi:predicted branched-subunit amino acid permease